MPDAMARAASLTGSSGGASAATAPTAGEATSAPSRWLGRLFKRRAVSEEGERSAPEASVELQAAAVLPVALSAQPSFVEQQDEIRSWAAARGDEYAAEEHEMAAAAAADVAEGAGPGAAEETRDEKYPLHSTVSLLLYVPYQY